MSRMDGGRASERILDFPMSSPRVGRPLLATRGSASKDGQFLGKLVRQWK